jgi:hypothetical protein
MLMSVIFYLVLRLKKNYETVYFISVCFNRYDMYDYLCMVARRKKNNEKPLK